MKNELCNKEASSIEEKQQGLAISSASHSVERLLEDCGPKISVVEKTMVINENVSPEEALGVLMRLRSEIVAGSSILKYVRLWMGDFASAYAKQMGIPMAKAANELAEVFGEKPKRILRLVNTSERSPNAFRESDVDYTILQDLADIPSPSDDDEKERLDELKVSMLKEIESGSKDRSWLKSKVRSLRAAVGEEEETCDKSRNLEDLLIQHYNLAKFFAECPDVETCSKIEASMLSLEPSIENLANARGKTLYFEMKEPPLVEGLSEEEQEAIDI